MWILPFGFAGNLVPRVDFIAGLSVVNCGFGCSLVNTEIEEMHTHSGKIDFVAQDTSGKIL